MKKYTHAWVAFKAIERLASAQLAASDRPAADSLVRWFLARKDGVIAGAWYPDEIIKDNASSHVFKITPATAGTPAFRNLPTKLRLRAATAASPLRQQPFTVDPDTNLPARCEALAHSLVDNLKIQQAEPKGSPIAPTDNHVALRFFMLSHYVADAHMPLHSDSRKFSDKAKVHGLIEGAWEEEVTQHFDIDIANNRFRYSPAGFPRPLGLATYTTTLLKRVEDDLATRAFSRDYGSGNNNVYDYMEAVCQHSYLLSYRFLPLGSTPANVTAGNWRQLPGQTITFEDFSVTVLADAIDSIARIWLRIWQRYTEWLTGQQD